MPSKDGGPAFPVTEANGFNKNNCSEGMTLRDYFAAKALDWAHDCETGGTIGDAEKELGLKPGEYRFNLHYPILLARRAYSLADAMLKAREQ